MKCHLAVGSYLKSRPVIICALFKDDPFTAYRVVRNSEQLDPCIRCGQAGDAGVLVHLKNCIADIERFTVTMRDIAGRMWFGAESFTYFTRIKLAEIRRRF